MSIYSSANHIIIVAGHAVFKNRDDISLTDDENWYLEPFQAGEPAIYLDHIRHGVEILLSDKKALLFFSGGMTSREAGFLSEARGYFDAVMRLYPVLPENAAGRIFLEEYACDSYQNLLFSINLFEQTTGHKPENVSLVSWRFKKNRFEMHRKTLDIEDSSFTYIGVGNPVDLDSALKGEDKTLQLFKKNPHGECPEIREKRRERNPFQRICPYF